MKQLTRICSKCKKEKVLYDFHKDRYINGGYKFTCKECLKSRRQYLNANRQFINVNSKICSRCRIIKHKNEFNFSKDHLDGLSGYCRECDREKSKKKRTYKEIMQRSHEARRKRNYILKKEVIQAYGGLCVCCGINNEELLTIDHINGNGKEHRKEIGNWKMYQWLKENNFPKDNFQLLCMSCNWSKSHNGYCPHAKHFQEQILPNENLY